MISCRVFLVVFLELRVLHQLLLRSIQFWGSVGRMFGRPGPGFSNQLQLRLIKRVKHLVGYKDCCTREKLREEGDEIVLFDVEHYAFGDVRTRDQYMEWTGIDVDNKKCHRIDWCNKGELL